MGSTTNYKCLSCKASLSFDPHSQKWKCKYCFSEFDKAQLDEVYGEENLEESLEEKGEESLEENVDENLEEEQSLDSYRCENCGAEIVADETTSATFCLYCKSPTIIKSRFKGKFRPEIVIPFKITKEQAEEKYRSWIKKKIFTPKMFKLDEEIEKITGIYAPFWLFDCKALGSTSGKGKKVTSYKSGEYIVTREKHYYVAREGEAVYEKVPVDSSKKLDDELMMMIEPYNYKDLTDFSMQYMTGFLAEMYDVEKEESEKVMKERVNNFIEERLRGTVTAYTSYIPTSSNVELKEISTTYCLLPIYLLVNEFNGKKHKFIVNGQTGKVVGETPISKMRQLVFAVITFIISWIVLVFGGALFV